MAESRGGAGAGPPSPATRALRDLLDAGTRLRHVVARRAGLTETELTTLDHLSRGPVGPAEVARLLDVSTAAVTGIVDRLVDRGHAQRRPHSEDRRRVVVELTDSGRREVLEHLAPMFVRLAALDAAFDEAELTVVQRYLEGARDALGAVTGGQDRPGADGPETGPWPGGGAGGGRPSPASRRG